MYNIDYIHVHVHTHIHVHYTLCLCAYIYMYMYHSLCTCIILCVCINVIADVMTKVICRYLYAYYISYCYVYNLNICNFIHLEIKFGDLLSNKDQFRRFLREDLHLEETVVKEILNATVNTNLVWYCNVGVALLIVMFYL